jgi:micrococcal nuclease
VYEYRATILKVVDGDTVDVDVDLGFDVHHLLRLRLDGIDAPERGKPGGSEATAFLRDLLDVGQPVIIRTEKDRQEKYGRYLATITLLAGGLPEKITVNTKMLNAGHAVEYHGGTR